MASTSTLVLATKLKRSLLVPSASATPISDLDSAAKSSKLGLELNHSRFQRQDTSSHLLHRN